MINRWYGLKTQNMIKEKTARDSMFSGIGEVVTHALSVVAHTCNGIITVDISGIDLASHTGSLY